LEAENIRLRQEVDNLEGQLECVVDAAVQLEAQVQTLRERVKALESEAASAGQLRQRVRELEGQLERAAHTEAAMQQGTAQWQGKVAAEQIARQRAEAQTVTVRQDNQHLQDELARWQQWGANAQATFQSLNAEVEGLRPLNVWVGHPCKVCKQPLPGIVSREDAAKAMENFGHTECLKKDSGSGVALLAGLAGLYALSQMRKGS
jgi:DNA repair exonuclease SbcCD ATPase subunit